MNGELPPERLARRFQVAWRIAAVSTSPSASEFNRGSNVNPFFRPDRGKRLANSATNHDRDVGFPADRVRRVEARRQFCALEEVPALAAITGNVDDHVSAVTARSP